MAFGEPHGARYLGDGTVPSTASEEEVQAALRDWLREADGWERLATVTA